VSALGRALRIVWFGLKSILFVVGFLVIGGLVALVVVEPWQPRPPEIADGSVLEITFDERLPESVSEGGFLSVVRGDALTLSRLVRVIDRAAADPRIRAIRMDLSAAELPFVHAETLAGAIGRFRAAGKRTYVVSEYYDLARYRFAAAFDEIWMPAAGEFAVTGVALQTPYAGELVDDLGIDPQLERRKRFKSAANVIAERRMPPELREAMTAMVVDLDDRLKDGIDADRPGVAEGLEGRLDRALMNPAAALEAGLVDRLGHGFELDDALDAPVITARDYLPLILEQDGDAIRRVALVVASGPISGGWGSPLEGDQVRAERLIATLREADADPAIDAIVLRVDSPGGAYAPSDAIRRAIEALDKPVIVSMGEVAGSGGYMIAMAADRIVAAETTITGSIGVIGGKIVFEELLARNGVRIETVRSGPDAAFNSPFSAYTPAQRQRLSRRIDEIYAEFVERVAEARGLGPAAAEAAAQGRVWTGRQALERGLVDRLGGFRAALEEAAEAAGAGGAADMEIVEYPRIGWRERLRAAADPGFVAARIGLAHPLLKKAAETAAVLDQPALIRLEMPLFDLR
jgi:protease-4